MRCFIAIDLEPHVLDQLSAIQKKIAENANLTKGLKWVEPTNVHLTLKFLGEVDDDQIPELCKRVQDAVADTSEFELSVSKVGTFGRPPRVLWAGVDKSPQLTQLQRKIEKSLAQAGFKEENREFSAHLTLCRIKNFSAGKKLQSMLKQYSETVFGTFWVSSVYVYRSELTSKGPIYTPIKIITLH